MNTYNGHIATYEKLREIFGDAEFQNYETVPKHLHEDAIKALNGRAETYIDINSDHPLAKWARKKTGRDKPIPKHPAFDEEDDR
jgi:hypothetical protein